MSTLPVAAGKVRVIRGGRKEAEPEDYDNTRADALFFRGQTLAIVRHFYEIASQIGRLPSILGREFFRAKVSHHAIPSFEEQAVFVHDVEAALGRLREEDAEVIALVGLFQYSLDDVAAMLGRSRSGVAGRFADSIDRLAELFLAAGLPHEGRPDRRVRHFMAVDVSETMPPRKPAASATAEAYHVVGQHRGDGSWGARRCDA